MRGLGKKQQPKENSVHDNSRRESCGQNSAQELIVVSWQFFLEISPEMFTNKQTHGKVVLLDVLHLFHLLDVLDILDVLDVTCTSSTLFT